MFGAILMTIGDLLEDQPYTAKERSKVTAGAVAALVIAGWLIVLAIVFLSVR
jgi:hypothetical protein